MNEEQNTHVQTAVRSELIVVNEALTELEKVEAGIAALSAKTKGVVFAVATPAGMRDAIAARASCRAPRLEVEKIRKAAKAPILELGRSVDGRAKAITEQLEALEEPIDAQIKVEEQRKETERLAKLEAERRRIATIQNNIAEILALPADAVGKTAIEIKRVVDFQTQRPAPSADFYQEFLAEAEQARADSLAKLIDLHTAAVKHEAAQEQLRIDQEELVRLRREDADRRERQAEADRIAREEADKVATAERAEQDRLAQIERDRLAQEEADRRAEQVEQDRLAAEARGREIAEAARIRDGEAKKLADDRATFERQKAEALAAEEAKHLAGLTLHDAAIDALGLLIGLGHAEHKITRRLCVVLSRDTNQAEAA